MERLSFRWIGVILAAMLIAACGGDMRGDLDADSQLALEIGIISTLHSPNAFHPTTLSDALRKRHEKIEGIQLRNSAYGSIMPSPKGGAIIKGSAGGRVLKTEISGSANASITVRDGEVGLVNGEIYVGEGTQLINAKGDVFTFMRGKWRAKTKKPLSSSADTVTVLTIGMSRDKSLQFGISDNESSRAFIAAADLFEAFKKLPPKGKNKALLGLVKEMEQLEVKSLGDDVVYLADIAQIQYRQAVKSSEDDEDVLQLGSVE